MRAVVEHHLDPLAALYGYDRSQAVLPSRPDLDALDWVVMDDPARLAEIAGTGELPPAALSQTEVDRLIDFLHALTDRSMLDLRADVPAAVPSGLPLAD